MEDGAPQESGSEEASHAQDFNGGHWAPAALPVAVWLFHLFAQAKGFDLAL
jgi:hypothetical protein